MTRPQWLLLPLLAGCAPGTWTVHVWGEEFIEDGIPAAEFSDGCDVVFDRFEVSVTTAELVDGAGDAVGSVPAGVWELTDPGPQEMGSVDATKGQYATARFVIGPTSGSSLSVAGTLTCAGSPVTFDWTFDSATTYDCEPTDLTVTPKDTTATELTVHGDHLFYSDLENPDAVLVGTFIHGADQDGNGDVTREEMALVDLAPLGLGVGSHGDITDLDAYIDQQVRTVGHVDGEGHCTVSY